MRIIRIIMVLAMALCFAVSAFAQQAVQPETKPEAKIVKKIKINTASAEELMELKGVGEKKAALIIEFRKLGKIKNADDLMKIKGIKQKFIEKNQDFISYE